MSRVHFLYFVPVSCVSFALSVALIGRIFLPHEQAIGQALLDTGSFGLPNHELRPLRLLVAHVTNSYCSGGEQLSRRPCFFCLFFLNKKVKNTIEDMRVIQRSMPSHCALTLYSSRLQRKRRRGVAATSDKKLVE